MLMFLLALIKSDMQAVLIRALEKKRVFFIDPFIWL